MVITKRMIILLGFLVLMVVIYVSNAYVLPNYEALTPSPPPPLPTPLPHDDIDPVYTELGAPCTVEYGDPFLINNNSDPLHAYIRYPQAGNPVDAFIHQWALNLYSDMAVRFSTGVELSPADFGEINVHFDSYLVDNRYAGIHQYGELSYNTTEHPQEVLKTFNIDLTEFKLLEPSDILDLENPDGVLSLLSLRLLVEHPSTDGYHVFMDESWLSYLLITNEGIVVFLPHFEDFLPDSFKSLTVTLPYEDLGSSLLIRRDAPLPSMPTPSPEPTPSPTPTPTPAADGEEPDGEEPDGEEPDGETTAAEEPEAEEPETEELETEEPAEEPEPTPAVPPQRGPIDPDKPIIALTFDDGPGMYTDELLDLLERYGVRATFFTVGNLAHTRTETLLRTVDMGCEVAGHSWNHKNLAKMSEEDVRLQLETTRTAIEAVTGVDVPLFRPPYGAVSGIMKEVSEEMGLSMINWNVDPEDWKNKDADKIFDLVMEQVGDRSIIISHEVYETTLEAYERIIPELLLQGYQIVTVTELLNMSNWRITPGYVYYNGQRVDIPS